MSARRSLLGAGMARTMAAGTEQAVPNSAGTEPPHLEVPAEPATPITSRG